MARKLPGKAIKRMFRLRILVHYSIGWATLEELVPSLIKIASVCIHGIAVTLCWDIDVAV
ncbi:MAG TPA: hypothetical protein EYO39_02415 [Nitrospirales bacterium]|nr:hypothetical protein [Nitrospirales bacterium]